MKTMAGRWRASGFGCNRLVAALRTAGASPSLAAMGCGLDPRASASLCWLEGDVPCGRILYRSSAGCMHVLGCMHMGRFRLRRRWQLDEVMTVVAAGVEVCGCL